MIRISRLWCTMEDEPAILWSFPIMGHFWLNPGRESDLNYKEHFPLLENPKLRRVAVSYPSTVNTASSR